MQAMHAALDHLTDRIRSAIAARQPLRIRGGGSKDFYGRVFHGELLETGALSGITAYEPSELYVTAFAGTPLAELEAALAEKGQCLPFEPPHFGGQPTVGGMVASGLSGPARAAVGSVRDYVLGLSMVNGKAERVQFGGTVMKNVAGYDVSRMLAGSLGTLGLMTEVSLKVLPFAPAEATLRFALDEATALRKLNEWGGQPLPLNASSWVNESGDADQPVLYLRLRGAAAAVEAAGTRLLKEVPGERVDFAQTLSDWTAARDLTLPWFTDGFARGQDLWRLSVAQSAAPLQVGDTMIDWLGAQRWVWADAGDAQAAQRLREAARAAGGHATLFIAAQRHSTPATEVFEPLNPVFAKIHRQLKAEMDPAGIFNAGRMFADL